MNVKGTKEYILFESALNNLIKIIESDIIKIDIDCKKENKSCNIIINKEEKMKIKL